MYSAAVSAMAAGAFAPFSMRWAIWPMKA